MITVETRLDIADRLDTLRGQVAMAALAVGALTVQAKEGDDRDELHRLNALLIACVEDPRAVGRVVQPNPSAQCGGPFAPASDSQARAPFFQAVRRRRLGCDWVAVECPDQPQDQEHDNDQAKCAA